MIVALCLAGCTPKPTLDALEQNFLEAIVSVINLEQVYLLQIVTREAPLKGIRWPTVCISLAPPGPLSFHMHYCPAYTVLI